MSAQTADPVVLNGALLRLPVDQIVSGPNARGDLGDLADLASSLRHLGQQKPVIVSQLPDGRYQLLDGHRRHAAAELAGLPTLDAILRRDRGPALRLQQQIAMHTHARAFDPMAEARACHSLMFEHNMSREQIAATVGRSPIWVRNRIALTRLTPAEQKQVATGGLSIDRALNLLSARRGDQDAPSRARAGGATNRRHCATCQCSAVAVPR